MKRQFVCGLLSTIILGFAVWAQANSAKEPSGEPDTPILRLHVAGPFVICETTDNNEPALEVLVPKVESHFPPHWYSDGKDHGTYEKMTYRLSVGRLASTPPPTAKPSGTTPPPPEIYGKLDVQYKPCEHLSAKVIKDDLFSTIWLPMPDEVIPDSPAKVRFDNKCDESDTTTDELYATKMDLLYFRADPDNVTVCQESTGSKCDPWFKAVIWPVNNVGNVSLEMPQNKKEPSGDLHHVAKESHRKMRHLIALDNHCPHFSNEEGRMGDSRGILFGTHTDCHAPLLIACALDSKICPPMPKK